MRKFLLTLPLSVGESTCEVCMMHVAARINASRNGVTSHFDRVVVTVPNVPSLGRCWGNPNKEADAFWAIASPKSLIDPDHTCSLYLPNKTQQTSSFSLLILQAIMIFCRGQLLMPFCWLRSHGQTGGVFGCRGSGRSAVPTDSVIPCLWVCRHASGDRGTLSLSVDLTSLCSGR